MRIVFTAVNASYIHSNLAVRQLAAVAYQTIEREIAGKNPEIAADIDIIIREYTINERNDEIVRDLFSLQADIYLFSTYIWNIRDIRELTQVLGKALPSALIGMGGPEISFDPEEQLKISPEVDFIVAGEGEEAIAKLLTVRYTRMWQQQRIAKPADILPSVIHELPNVICRHPAGGYLYGPHAKAVDMSKLPFPYGEKFPDTENRIVYYESCRGCPFNCAYCLSSTDAGVRAKTVEQVCSELAYFLDNPVRQVKFVDRTFNYNRKRAFEIWSFLIKAAHQKLAEEEEAQVNGEHSLLIDNQPTVRRITGERKSVLSNFHFELAADLLDDELIELLCSAPAGLFQLEIGVQSTDAQVLSNIDRKQSMDDLSSKVRRLRDSDNIHIHLDLIAGLPGEDLLTFRKSFNEVIELRPHALQLGFLKLLKGTKLRRDADRGDALYNSEAPYEVISTKVLTYADLSALKDIEWLVDRLYNSGQYMRSMEALIRTRDDSFTAFDDLARFARQLGVYGRRISKDELTVILDYYFASQSENEGKIGQKALYQDYLDSPHGSEQDWERIHSRYSFG